MVDINADIIPGRSAAGFQLGQHYSLIQAAELNGTTVAGWEPGRSTLPEAIESTSGWFACDSRRYSRYERAGMMLCYGHGAVRLDFTPEGHLYAIAVASGYTGRFAGAIQVGGRLDEVLEFMDLDYDDGDELHYPAEGSTVRGIGFYAVPAPLKNDPDQLIVIITVHDWALMRGETGPRSD